MTYSPAGRNLAFHISEAYILQYRRLHTASLPDRSANPAQTVRADAEGSWWPDGQAGFLFPMRKCHHTSSHFQCELNFSGTFTVRSQDPKELRLHTPSCQHTAWRPEAGAPSHLPSTRATPPAQNPESQSLSTFPNENLRRWPQGHSEPKPPPSIRGDPCCRLTWGI